LLARREFLRRLFALSGTGAAASALPALAAVAERGPRLHVVIVGAGLAGLVSARADGSRTSRRYSLAINCVATSVTSTRTTITGHSRLRRRPRSLTDAERRELRADTHNHPYSSGAFAWFLPSQRSELHRYIVAPEGRIYFAGEHASLTHTRMQGALESGLRATREMLEAAQKT
jgi:hypothetical protein